MFKIYNEVLIKRIKACIFLMIIIILSQTLGGCYYQENVTYKIDFSLSGYGTDNKGFQTSLSKENQKYECSLNMFDYFICVPTLNVYQYKNDKLVSGKPVYKANIAQMRTDFGVESVSYNIEKEQITENVDFCFDNFHLTNKEIENGSFAILNKIGKHKLQFAIPAMQQYGTEALSFEVVLNVEEDSRSKFTETYLAERDGKRKPDVTLNGMDFYEVSEQPEFRVVDASSGEYLIGNNGGSSGVMPCGGQLFVSYRKLDESYFSNVIEYSIQEGLYLCNVSFLNSSEYRSNSYQCYILYKTK
ncbi:MAG: hypothetical protein SO434_05165 [Eubacteriales bacterium]|nr:hypothetical protein [Eubacteriales bacterium]